MILAIAQTEDRRNLDKQILKQTIQPDRCIWFVDPEPIASSPDLQTIDRRRERIADNHLKLMEIVEAYQPDLVWQLEGDGELPPDTLEKLLKDYERLKSPNFGYVSGVEVGRHGIYALGAWRFSDNEFSSLSPKLKGLHKVDATGFYCLLAERETWLNGNCFWNGERWGPDVNWALSLRELGYTIYVDMDIPVGHITERRILWPSDSNIEQVKFYKNKLDKWEYTVL